VSDNVNLPNLMCTFNHSHSCPHTLVNRHEQQLLHTFDTWSAPLPLVIHPVPELMEKQLGQLGVVAVNLYDTRPLGPSSASVA